MSNTMLICVQHNADVVEIAGFKINPSLSSYLDLIVFRLDQNLYDLCVQHNAVKTEAIKWIL